MARPATSREILDLVRRSGLIEEPRLQKFLQSGVDLATPQSTLAELLSQGLLTKFQADLICQGRWKGFILSGYRLIDKLGRGGMGQVYLAEHIALRKRVALKVLSAHLSDDETVLARFAREARAAAAVSHPNIVHVIDIDIDHRPAFLVMEFIHGITLQAAVAKAGTFCEGIAASCGRQAALALQAAHSAGMVHRDVKPANFLLTPSGQLKMLDLGIVRLEADDEHGLTMAGGSQLVLGTADYLAPEQALDSHQVDIRADIYGLGGTLYFLLAGHPPFPNGSSNAKLTRKQFEDPVSIRKLRPDLSPKFADVIMAMLARHRDNRPAAPLDVAVALQDFARFDSKLLGKLFHTQTTNQDTLDFCMSTQTPPAQGKPPPARNSPSGHALDSVLNNNFDPEQPTLRVDIPKLCKSKGIQSEASFHVVQTKSDSESHVVDDFSNFGYDVDTTKRNPKRDATSKSQPTRSQSRLWLLVLGGVVMTGLLLMLSIGLWMMNKSPAAMKSLKLNQQSVPSKPALPGQRR